MVAFFDEAFRLRTTYPDAPVLTYALGLLFGTSTVAKQTAEVAESCISQCLLSEPGCAQKAVALLRFWVYMVFHMTKQEVRPVCLVPRHCESSGGWP